ncbi:MAG: MBOAT family protein, partial [Eubacteriales bacterium]
VAQYNLSNYGLVLILCTIASTPLCAKQYKKLPEKTAMVLTPVLILAGLVITTAYLVDATYNPFLYFRF